MKALHALLLGVSLCSRAFAQQPFYTDDADVTERHRFHMEISNQQSWLQRSALPATKQSTTVFQLNYGLTRNFEIGMDSPLIGLYQQLTPTTLGNGDTNITFKLRLRPEETSSRMPSITLSCAIETPTGSVKKQLGSGIADYGCNSVVQKLIGLWTLRVNNGAVFSGNTLTGLVGLRAKGLVYTGSGSITRDVLPRLLLGVELNGSAAKQGTVLGKSTLQTQFGGKFAWKEDLSIDFGVLAGWFSGAPRTGLQIGFSKDF
ncbi:MAG: hypothetical protein ABIR70_02680 [Bryobacteraceae bacterium]